MVDKRVEIAKKYFDDGFACSQAVLIAFAEKFGLTEEQALRISTAFGGGLARKGDVCGAVAGALMVIGLKYGRVTIEDKDSREKTYDLSVEFIEKFEQKHGSVGCRELIDYDLSTEEGLKMANDDPGLHGHCLQFVKDAVILLDEIL